MNPITNTYEPITKKQILSHKKLIWKLEHPDGWAFLQKWAPLNTILVKRICHFLSIGSAFFIMLYQFFVSFSDSIYVQFDYTVKTFSKHIRKSFSKIYNFFLAPMVFKIWAPELSAESLSSPGALVSKTPFLNGPLSSHSSIVLNRFVFPQSQAIWANLINRDITTLWWHLIFYIQPLNDHESADDKTTIRRNERWFELITDNAISTISKCCLRGLTTYTARLGRTKDCFPRGGIRY